MNKFNGIDWIKKKGIPVNIYREKMNLMNIRLINKIVLDAGCGEGGKAVVFSKITKKIYGIDINRNSINKARQKCNSNNISFYVGSVEQMPFKDNIFDVVYAAWIIEHLKNPKKFINEVFRILREGGIFILWIPNLKSITGFLAKYISLSLKVRLLKVLTKKNEVSHQKCYYRANSVRKLDRICKNKFNRIYLKRFDTAGYVKNFRILTYLWFLKHRFITKIKLLKCMQQEFYVEFKKCSS